MKLFNQSMQLQIELIHAIRHSIYECQFERYLRLSDIADKVSARTNRRAKSYYVQNGGAA
jgi:hypothetical protein